MAGEVFDKPVYIGGGAQGGLVMGAALKNVNGAQAGPIEDVAHASGEAPTAEEFDALVDAFNALLRAVRSGSGVCIVAAS